MEKLSAVVVGYGSRGRRYSDYALLRPEELVITAVAEPVENKRKYAKEQHNIADDMEFCDWREMVKLPRLADCAIIATQDNFHFEPALAFIEKGYHILLEKPMAPTPEECKIICEAAEKKGVKVIVCHVLRFTPFFRKLKDIIDSGEIGEIMSVIHSENVGYLHFSHSFVRGNWRNSKESSPMILAKSCHDTDILQWLIGKKCTKVQSFGDLTHFTHENKPENAPTHCAHGCPYAEDCYYNAVKFYYDNKTHHWRDVVANKISPSDEEVWDALVSGPYGRCVFECDNDVVDHQVVNMQFEGGATVSFTMSAFNQGGRFMRIFGTKGEISAIVQENIIKVYSFKDKKETVYEVEKKGEGIESGHGGGDTGIMADLVKYIKEDEITKSVSDIRTSYLNHLIAFAAEESRLTEKVVDMEKYSESL